MIWTEGSEVCNYGALRQGLVICRVEVILAMVAQDIHDTVEDLVPLIHATEDTLQDTGDTTDA